MEDPNEGTERRAEAPPQRRNVVHCTGKIAHVLGRWTTKLSKSLWEKTKFCIEILFLFIGLWVSWGGEDFEEHSIKKWMALIIKGVLNFIFAWCLTIVDCESPVFWLFLNKILVLSFPFIVEAERDKKIHDQSTDISKAIRINETGEIFMTVEGYAVLLEYFTLQLSYRVEDVIKAGINLTVASAICYIYGLTFEQYLNWKILEFVIAYFEMGSISWTILKFVVVVFKVGSIGWAIFKFIAAVWNYEKTKSIYKEASEQWDSFKKNEGGVLAGYLETIPATSMAAKPRITMENEVQ